MNCYIQRITIIIGLSFCVSSLPLKAQKEHKLPLFSPAPSFHTPRFWTGTISAGVLYTGTIIGLNSVWYDGYERTGFHTFNDWNEWENVDKMGHMYTAYLESRLSYKGLRWAGVAERKAAFAGAGLGLLFQTSIEVLDAYSAKWGFSWYDMGFNVLGSGIFLSQQLIWQEQRISIKFSTHFMNHPSEVLYQNGVPSDRTLTERSDELFGKSIPEQLLKDYNAQTYWISGNVQSLFQNQWPPWMNVALGYGGENMYGGFDNTWDWNGQQYTTGPNSPARYWQLYLSPDIDFSRIPVKSKPLKVILEILNIVKMPAPTLEYRSSGGFDFHWVFF